MARSPCAKDLGFSHKNKKPPLGGLLILMSGSQMSEVVLNFVRGGSILWHEWFSSLSFFKWKAKELTAVEAMQEAGVKKTSFYKLVKALEEETVKSL